MMLFPLVITILFPTTVFALWPLPKSMSTGSTPLRLATNFDIIHSAVFSGQDLIDAIQRTEAYLNQDKHERLVVGRSSADDATINGSPTLPSLSLSLADGAPPIRPIPEETSSKDMGSRSESYTLTIPADGSGATLTANTSLGLYRGLTTFAQLWYWSASSGAIYTLQAPISIQDAPAYPYRGFMLDTARNYFPVDDIKRTLDAMSWVKLNSFHWHIVDAQSFPLSITNYPNISLSGAYSPSQTYSPADVDTITSYAAARGIDVLLEIDTPGHTASISLSYPEHIACAFKAPWDTYAAEAPAGQLRIANADTVQWAAGLVRWVARTVPSRLFGTGGDEVNLKCYADDEQTQADLKKSGKTVEEALDGFVQAVHAPLLADGKTPVVWEEMVLDHNVTLDKSTIIMVWRSSANTQKVAAKGFRIIHAPSDYFYLDCGAGEWIGGTANGTSWCDPFKSWQKAYSFDPLNGLSPDQQKLVIGGEQLLWTEQSSPENLDSIVWPRAASSAEVFWTGAPANERNSVEALPRLHDLRFRMVRRGVRAIMLQPQFCALRVGVCEA